MPYGYYQIYRFSATLIFFYLAYSEEDKKGWMIVWGISGLIVQPFFKLALGRDIWNFLDIVWAILLIISLFLNRTQSKIKENTEAQQQQQQKSTTEDVESAPELSEEHKAVINKILGLDKNKD